MAITAKFEGRCSCGESIGIGDLIVPAADGRGYVHEECAERRPGPLGRLSGLELKPNETVCTQCFIVRPCGCEDGL